MSRVPDLVPLRYGRMLVSPFTFYRGAALVMAADLAGTPVSGFRAQLCGDAHLSNFGVFATPERRMVFDINDFDETLPGPWEWDVKRLVASLAVAGRDNGYSRKERAPGRHAGRRRRTARRCAASPTCGNLDVFYASVDVDAWLQAAGAAPLTRKQRRAPRRTRQGPHPRLHAGAGQADRDRRRRSGASSATRPCWCRSRRSSPSSRPQDLYAALREIFESYRRSLQPDRRVLIDQFHLVQVARKVVGVGSVGTRAWIILLLGRDDGDPLFLQAKEAQPSVLEAYAGASAYGNQGRRVVAGQRLMQAASDIFLGWTARTGDRRHARDFYVRQLWDGKASADSSRWSPPGGALRAGLRLDAGPGARPLRRPARDRGLPRPGATASTARWSSSPRPTPTRTSATSTSWRQQSGPAGSSPYAGCDRQTSAPAGLARGS